jgi:hypothetical protein
VYPTPEGRERSAYKGKNITCQPMKSGKVPREAYMDGKYPWVSDVRPPPALLWRCESRVALLRMRRVEAMC